MNEIIKNIEAAQLKETVPSFNVGDTVRVSAKIKEDVYKRQADEQGITRQGVHDLIRRCDRTLLGYALSGVLRRNHTKDPVQQFFPFLITCVIRCV